MNFEHYRNFVAIIDAGTLSAASKTLYVAQPALSNQLKAFEAEYGAQLVVRGPRHLELTDAGRIFYDRARDICNLEDAARKEIQASVSGERGTLWLGLTPASPDPVMAGLLSGFHRSHPDVTFEIIEASSDQLVKMLKNGLIEVGVIRTPGRIPPFLLPVSVIEERLMAVYQRENPWLPPQKGELSIQALKDVPICLSRGFQRRVEEVCLQAGFKARVLSVSSSRAMALMWARHGAGVAVTVSPDKQEPEFEGMHCRPLKGRDLHTRRAITVLRERKFSACAAVFAAFCQSRL
jgi:DNA-binding transcriptional LysR family regulator